MTDTPERKEISQRIAAQLEVTRVLAEASSPDGAIPRILEAVCRNLHWDWGALWMLDPDANVLRCTDTWQDPALDLADFHERSIQSTFALGVGLPGRVWSSRGPAWIEVLDADSNFPRLPYAAKSGLKSGFGFPIFLSGALIGVMEFFSRSQRLPDQNLNQILETIGNQIGLFLDRKRATEALTQSESLKTAILESALDSIITIDHRGTVLEWNPAAEATFGYSRQEAVGREMAELIIPHELREAHRWGLEVFLERRVSPVVGRRLEMPALKADGSRFPAELTVTRSGSTIPPVFTGYLRDITERKRTEQELRWGEQRYRSFIEQSTEGIWRFELEVPLSTDASEDAQIEHFYRFAYLAECNDAMARMYGYRAAADLLGARLAQLLPQSNPDNMQYLRQFVRSGYRLSEAESHETDRTGSSKYFLNNLVGILEDGQIRRAWGTQRDITEQKHAAEALRASEERFRHMADSAPVLMWIAGPDKLCTWFNRPWLEFTGRALDQALGDGWAQGVHPDDRPKCTLEYNAAFDARRALTMEYRLRRHDGEYRWILDTGIPLYGAGRRFAGYIGSCIDIDDRKRAEEERAMLLAGERAARAEAERASRMKDEFLGTLSHELRTPLNAILGWSHLLQTGGTSAEETVQGLEAIERNARAQTQIIEDLLDMSRIISGKIRLDVQRVELTPIVEAALETVRPAAEAKEIRIEQHFATPAVVRGDANRLQQILWNLLSNAIKFTPRHGTVRVRVKRVRSHVEIEISDTGEGIGPEFLPHVFERFRQADASTTRRHGGLGLGLAIAKQLIELHGGRIRAESAGVGQGSTFTIWLPVTAVSPVAEPDDDQVPAEPRVSPLGSELPSLEGIKVLVVDDEEDARTLISRLLVQWEAEVFTAAAADEAMRMLSQHKPDVLVSDIGMPEQDGYELIRMVRALPADCGGKTPALALTAFARSEDRRRALLTGYHMHISKPVEPSELIAVIASLAGRTRSEDGVAR